MISIGKVYTYPSVDEDVIGEKTDLMIRQYIPDTCRYEIVGSIAIIIRRDGYKCLFDCISCKFIFDSYYYNIKISKDGKTAYLIDDNLITVLFDVNEKSFYC